RPQVVAVREPPSLRPVALQDVGPDRLDDVDRVELGPEWGGQPPPHHRAEERLIIAEDPLRGGILAVGQFHEQGIERVGAHDRVRYRRPGRPGNWTGPAFPSASTSPPRPG